MKMCNSNLSITLAIFVIVVSSIDGAKPNPKRKPNQKMYPYMDLYNAPYDPYKYCPDFYCKESGLTESEQLEIVNSGNQYRNQFAGENRINNMFQMHYLMGSGFVAQEKAFHCLPPTKSKPIFDFKMAVRLYAASYFEDGTTNTPMVVLIGKREELRSKTTKKKMKDSSISFYMANMVNTPTVANNLGSTGEIGCGYVLRRNDTHFIDHFVSIIGPLDNVTRDWKAKNGKPCTNCKELLQDRIGGCVEPYQNLCNDGRLFNVFTAKFRCENINNLKSKEDPSEKNGCDLSFWKVMLILLLINLLLALILFCLFIFAPIKMD